MRPASKTAIRSLSVSASSWSWVTKTKVMPSSRWSCFELDLHLLAQLEVEGAERLVEQEHPRLEDDRTGEGHPLALATGELGGPAGAEVAEAHGLQRLAGALAALPLADPRTRSP